MTTDERAEQLRHEGAAVLRGIRLERLAHGVACVACIVAVAAAVLTFVLAG